MSDDLPQITDERDSVSDLVTILIGDVREQLRTLPAESVHCVVTSPPYWGLRDYGVAGQLGLEKTPAEYVANMVAVFREVRRVLRTDGVVWLNLGDSFASGKGTCYNPGGGEHSLGQKRKAAGAHPLDRGNSSTLAAIGLKPKDLVGIPWRVAFALQADGWYLRSDIIWHKPNPMPESVTDRPTKSHEYVFLLTKSAKYFYDAEAVREPHTYADRDNRFLNGPSKGIGKVETGKYAMQACGAYHPNGRNLRSVWTIPTQAYSGNHFATFPEKLVEPCIKAGTSEYGCCPTCGAPWRRVVKRERVPTRIAAVPPWAAWRRVVMRERVPTRPGKNTKVTGDSLTDGNRDPKRHVTERQTTGWQPTCECDTDMPPMPCVVLDPFFGSGTTGIVAARLGRRCIGIELNADYVKLAHRRLAEEVPLFAQGAIA